MEEQEVKQIPLDVIIPSGTNPRKDFTGPAMDELVANIKAKGVLYPVTVRMLQGDRLKLVDGERRFKAAKAAGLGSIPAIIVEMTDDEAIDAQLISFIQRSDITPLEEAEAFSRLLKQKLGDSSVVAAKIGKPIAYVEQRLKLLALIEPAKKALRANVLTVGHATLICRLQPKDQERAIQFAVKTWQQFEDGDFGYRNGLNPDASDEHRDRDYFDPARTVCSVKDLKEFIDLRINLDLKEAAFDVKDKELLPKAGACLDCPKRTGFNKELFNDIGKGDFCTDAECFHAKQQAFLEQLKKGLKKDKKRFVEITRDQRKPEGHPGSMTERSFKYVKKACKFTKVGIYIDEDSKGKTALVCAAKRECKQHFGDVIKQRRSDGLPVGPKPQTLEEIEEARIAEVRKTIESEVTEILANRVMKPAVLAKIPDKFGKQELLDVYFQFDRDYSLREGKEALKPKGKPESWSAGMLTRVLLASIAFQAIDNYEYDDDALPEVAKRFDLDLKKLSEPIRAEVEKKHAKNLKSQLPEKPKEDSKAKGIGLLGVPCPTCTAKIGEPCKVRKDGAAVKDQIHLTRWATAEQAASEPKVKRSAKKRVKKGKK